MISYRELRKITTQHRDNTVSQRSVCILFSNTSGVCSNGNCIVVQKVFWRSSVWRWHSDGIVFACETSLFRKDLAQRSIRWCQFCWVDVLRLHRPTCWSRPGSLQLPSALGCNPYSVASGRSRGPINTVLQSFTVSHPHFQLLNGKNRESFCKREQGNFSSCREANNFYCIIQAIFILSVTYCKALWLTQLPLERIWYFLLVTTRSFFFFKKKNCVKGNSNSEITQSVGFGLAALPQAEIHGQVAVWQPLAFSSTKCGTQINAAVYCWEWD